MIKIFKLLSVRGPSTPYLWAILFLQITMRDIVFLGISDSLVKLGKISLVNSLVKLGIKKTGCRKSAVVDEIYNNSVPKYIFILNVKPRSGKF